MVAELDIKDQDVNEIAEMIDSEIASLVPEWKAMLRVEDDSYHDAKNIYHACSSTGSILDYASSLNTNNLQVLEGSDHGCAAVHGRFEEIKYRDSRISPSQMDGALYTDIRAQRESSNSKIIYCDDTHKLLEKLTFEDDDERIIRVDDKNKSNYCGRKSYSVNPQSLVLEDYENEIRQELRWLKAKYQMRPSEMRDQQLGVPSSSAQSPQSNQTANNEGLISKTISFSKHLSLNVIPNARCANAVANGSFSSERMVTAKRFHTNTLLPQPLHRATSLPVNAVDS